METYERYSIEKLSLSQSRINCRLVKLSVAFPQLIFVICLLIIDYNFEFREINYNESFDF